MLVVVGSGAAGAPDTAARFSDQFPAEVDVNWGEVPSVYVVPLTVTVNTELVPAEVENVPVIVGVVVAAARLLTVGGFVAVTAMF